MKKDQYIKPSLNVVLMDVRTNILGISSGNSGESADNSTVFSNQRDVEEEADIWGNEI